MKSICRFCLRITKKSIKLIGMISVLLTSIGINYFIPVNAEITSQTLSFMGDVTKNGDAIEYREGETLVASIITSISGVTQTPVGTAINLPSFTETYQVGFDVTLTSGYRVTDYCVNGSSCNPMPGSGLAYTSIESSSSYSVRFNFSVDNPGSGGEPGGGDVLPSMYQFPTLGYFSNLDVPVESNSLGEIVIPDGWTGGTISFKAKICEENGEVVPDDGSFNCDAGTNALSQLEIEGINNRDSINESVSGYDDEKIEILPDFFNYGFTGIHLTNDILNITVNVVTEDLLMVEVEAPMPMSYSYGTATIDKAIVTKLTAGNVSIFFGNTEANLYVRGQKVDHIVEVLGSTSSLNEDGSYKVTLPPLDEETTTTVTVKIMLTDDSIITRSVNILRTAMELSYEGESKTINAGYVVYKGYLYNNQPHNHEIFNAYLQVILYRDDVVVGYRQVEIDDEELVNGLENNQDGAIESIGPDRILLYTDDNQGINRASVFLTNGPIDYTSDTLPSIEFGLGAGVTIEWGEE